MNAPLDPLTRSEQQALSAPFFVEDPDVVRCIARIADERGTSMAEVVASAVDDYRQRHDRRGRAPPWMETFWAEHPLPLPSGLKTDKRFYDSLYDDE